MVNITNINPNTLTLQTISAADVAVIPNTTITSSFNPVNDRVEYFVYDFNNNLLSSNSDLRSYKPVSIDSVGNIIDMNLFPEEDATIAGYTTGIVKTIYNFISPEVGSGDNPLFISEISPTRTELRLSSNTNELFIAIGLTADTFLSSSNYEIYNQFRQNVENSSFLDEFYLNFGNNVYVIGVNSVLEFNSQNNTVSLLVKLYEPLPTAIGLKTELSVVTKKAESVAYQLDFIQEDILDETTIKIAGPNYNIPIKDETGPLTQYQNYSSITSTPLTGSLYQLMNQISSSSPQLSVDYTDYEDFIFFSSAYQRLYNFKEKVISISSSQAQLDLLYSNISGPTTASAVVSSSKLLLEKQIETTITSFDGYEYFLYYTSGAYAWPKTNAQPPYNLYSPTSTQATNWYATQSAIAIEYDANNQNNLDYVIPEYIRSNSSNNQYLLFTSMIGQFFDEIWLYTKAITSKLDANSNLYEGVSKDLVATVLTSLGTKIYDSTYTLENIYSSVIGLSASGSLYPSTGSELITSYVTASVPSPEDIPTIDDFVKLSYKKIYNALPYLLKKKGTNAGLRSLINIFGIPDTILQINEFGGKNKVGTNDWDYWQDKFNYKFDITSSNSKVIIPWQVNSLWNTPTPNTLQFRFKTLGLDSAIANNSQSLWTLDNSGNTSIVLEYTGSGYSSGSYSGSIPSSSNEYATLKFIPNYSTNPTVSASIYLPFFNGDWWSVMVTRSGSNFSLFAADNIYNGNDGFIIGYTGSATASATTSSWINSTSSFFPLSGSTLTIGSKTYSNFSGSYQEIRYYNTQLTQDIFYDYTMNPYSIEGVGINGAYDQLIFRGALGNDLYTGSKSIHPKITGSYITQSFTSNSNFTINSGSFSVNREFILQDQIPAGMRNTVSKKIKNISTILPYSGSEEVNLPQNTVLSPFIYIDQDSYNSSSYVEDIKYVEVAFSPQNEINEDINAQIGYFNIGDYIGDPRLVSSSDYFDKYFDSYNLWDYIRLIRYYDNALFKMVKDYVPVRSSVTTGIVIKQHILERNKYPVPQVNTYTTTSFYGSGSASNTSWDTPFVYQDLIITGSPIQMYEITGSTGGVMPDLFGLTSSEYTGNNVVNITQSWDGVNLTPVGAVPFVESTQTEFYNGELSGSYIQVENGELNEDNPYKMASTILLSYDTLGSYFTTSSTSVNSNPSAGNLTFNTVIGYNGIQYSYYTNTLYINEVDTSGTNIQTALSNLQAGNTIQFTVTGSVNDPVPDTYYPYGATLTGLITSISSVNAAVWKITLSDNLNFRATFYTGSFGFNYINLPGQVQNSIVNLNPFLNDNANFDNSDFNPLISNALISRPNSQFFDVDFATSNVVAVNKTVIVNASRGTGSATPSTTPASNYTTARIANPRYDGCENTSPDFNVGYSSSLPSVEVDGAYFAYFDWVGGTTPEVINKSGFHIKYLIDVNGNVLTPNLTGSYYYNLIRTFNEQYPANVIFQAGETSGNVQPLQGIKSVIKGGALAQAVIFSQTGSVAAQALLTMSFSDTTPNTNYGIVAGIGSQTFDPYTVYTADITTVISSSTATTASLTGVTGNYIALQTTDANVQVIPQMYLSYSFANFSSPISPSTVIHYIQKSTDNGTSWTDYYSQSFSLSNNTQYQRTLIAPPDNAISGSRYRGATILNSSNIA